MLQPSNDRITAALIVSPKGTQREKAQDAGSGSRGAYQRNDFKEDVVWIYKGILPGHKKEWNDAICKNMNGPRDDQTKWSKSDKDKYDIAYTLKSKKKKMIQMNLFTNRNRFTDFKNKFTVTKGGTGQDGGKLGVWDSHIHITVYKVDDRQGLTVLHKELSILY